LALLKSLPDVLDDAGDEDDDDNALVLVYIHKEQELVKQAYEWEPDDRFQRNPQLSKTQLYSTGSLL
jgi:hypothetical protein